MINAKELFYIHSIFEPTQVNSSSFMLAYMHAVGTVKKGLISIGGVITSIACVLGLEAQLAALDPLLVPSLDIHVCRHMWLIKNMRDERYSLMIGNREVLGVVLPCLDRTHVKNRANWIYNLNVGTEWKFLRMSLLMVPPMISMNIESETLLYTSHFHIIPPIFLLHLHTPYHFSLTLL